MIANGSPAPAAFGVALLGPCRFTLDATEYGFLRRRSALPLLVFLALKRAAPVARDYVAFSLWPDECEDRARELLRRNLFLLARSMPGCRLAPWILAENDTLWWNARAPWDLDVARFEDAYRCGDPAELAAAVETYRGDLCEGLYDEWIFGERERLRGRYLDALDRLVRVHHGRGEPGLALAYALRARAAEPWREDVARRVMRLRFELGDRGGAIAEFETFARRLREEFGAEPMPETLVARDEILRSGGAARVRPARATLPLAGRERELQRLRAAWSRASRGEGSVVLVTGEGGIGKTRLLAEFALAVEGEGGRVLAGATSLPERRAYEAIGDALASSWRLFAELPIEASDLAALAAVVSDVRARSKPPSGERREPVRKRARFSDALARALAALASQRPALLVLDDLHAAGEATLSALEHVAAASTEVPLLIVAALRTGAASALHGRFRRDRWGGARISTLPLARLSASDVALAAGPSLREPGVLEELALACAGNPRALETLLQARTSAPATALPAARARDERGVRGASRESVFALD